MSNEDTNEREKKMTFVCKYKENHGTTFYVDVKEVTLTGFSGTYTTTNGKSKKISYDSGDFWGSWGWNQVNCVRIKDTTP